MKNNLFIAYHNQEWLKSLVGNYVFNSENCFLGLMENITGYTQLDVILGQKNEDGKLTFITIPGVDLGIPILHVLEPEDNNFIDHSTYIGHSTYLLGLNKNVFLKENYLVKEIPNLQLVLNETDPTKKMSLLEKITTTDLAFSSVTINFLFAAGKSKNSGMKMDNIWNVDLTLK